MRVGNRQQVPNLMADRERVIVLGVVPARGGSKGVPRKNIRRLAGWPLLWYTIEAAQRAQSLDRIVVSTDDPEIAQVARDGGAEVIMRPAAFATDEAPTELALIHAVETLAQTGYRPEAVVTLEPTSPLRSPELIDRCVRELQRTGADAVLSVIETRECLGRLDGGGRFEYLIKDQPRRRQDRQPLYKESSTVYVTRTATLLERRSVLGERLHAVVAAPEEAVDINTEIDFLIVEALLHTRSPHGART